MAKQHQQVIKGDGSARVSKWQRSGGSRKPLEEPGTFRSKVTQGAATLAPPMVIDRREPIRAKPLGEFAADLLGKYLRRRALWRAVTEWGAPIAWAGKSTMDVGSSQSHAIYKELQEAGGPSSWFMDEVEEGLASGKIVPGRATKASEIADAFYRAIIGSCREVYEFLPEMVNASKFDLGIELRKCKDPVATAAIEYLLHASLMQRSGGN